MTATMPCPHGCATTLDPATPCTECGHQLTIAEQRRLADRDRILATIARVRTGWEQWKDDHPKSTTRRTA